MVNKIKLSQMYFGDEDGATEASKENFQELFYDKDNYYNELIEGDKFLVVGRKGTGKTILANYLNKTINSSSKKHEVSSILTGHDIKLYKFLSKGTKDIEVDEMEILCEYILLSYIIETIIKTNSIKKYVPFTQENSARKILKNDKFLFKLNSYNDSEAYDTSGNIDIKSKPSIMSRFSTKTDKNFTQKEYYEKIKTLRCIIKKLCKNYNRYFILDELDDLKIAEKMDKKFSQYIASLINVTKRLNNEFADSNGSLKFIVMVRSDIIRHLNENDSNINKAIANKCIKLNWIKKVEQDFKHPLMELVLQKIKTSVPECKDKSFEEIYNLVFPFEIKNKSVTSFLLDNSFGRPRDIISYLNTIKRNNKDDYFRPGLFTYNYKDYSMSFYDELNNEICIHEEKDVIKDALNLIQSYRKINFYFKDIEQYYNDNKQEYPNILNLRFAFTLLYKFGIIGNTWIAKKQQNKKHIYYVSWEYREDSNSSINFKDKFTVHYALRPSMSLPYEKETYL